MNNEELLDHYREELIKVNDVISTLPDGYYKKDMIRHYYRLVRKLNRLERESKKQLRKEIKEHGN